MGRERGEIVGTRAKRLGAHERAHAPLRTFALLPADGEHVQRDSDSCAARKRRRYEHEQRAATRAELRSPDRWAGVDAASVDWSCGAFREGLAALARARASARRQASPERAACDGRVTAAAFGIRTHLRGAWLACFQGCSGCIATDAPCSCSCRCDYDYDYDYHND